MESKEEREKRGERVGFDLVDECYLWKPSFFIAEKSEQEGDWWNQVLP